MDQPHDTGPAAGPRRATLVASVAVVLIGLALVASPMIVGPGDRPVGSLGAAEGRFVSAWLPYWKVDSGMESFRSNASMFTDLTTFFHTATGSTAAITSHVGEREMARIVSQTHSAGVLALAAVIDETPSGTMRGILLEPEARSAHIQALLPLVDEHGYDGIDIDYEQFAFADGVDTWSTTRPAWVAFITELSAELHARGKYLTVAVPPQFDTDAGYWVYDWPAIEEHVDSLRVMTYDYSVAEPGPISPLPWVERATEFGVETMAPQKFRVGVPTYGRDWAVSQTGEGCDPANLPTTVSRTAAQMLDLAAAEGAEVQFDETNAESHFTYTEDLPDCAVEHQAHFSDARSVAAKAHLARTNATGVALWSLGGEDPAMWDALREADAAAAGG